MGRGTAGAGLLGGAGFDLVLNERATAIVEHVTTLSFVDESADGVAGKEFGPFDYLGTSPSGFAATSTRMTCHLKQHPRMSMPPIETDAPVCLPQGALAKRAQEDDILPDEPLVPLDEALANIDQSLFPERLEPSSGTHPRLALAKAPSPLKGEIRYRGWYHQGGGKSKWCPSQSKYDAPRAGGKTHGGVDFSSFGNDKVIAVVGGTVEWRPFSNTWGKHIYLYFTHSDGKRYIVVYAHLSKKSFDGTTKAVSGGDVIGTAGCTGNAGVDGACDRSHRCSCGNSEYRPVDDHLHLEVISIDGKVRYDPIKIFGWTVKYADDRRCAICS